MIISLKVYGDIALPPGNYEAVRIELGSAKGQNWWCLMFLLVFCR